MSRAINMTMGVEDIEKLCAKHGFRVSTVEPLASGGSRVVLLDGRDAERLRAVLGSKIIAGEVRRSAAHVSRQPPPSYR